MRQLLPALRARPAVVDRSRRSSVLPAPPFLSPSQPFLGVQQPSDSLFLSSPCPIFNFHRQSIHSRSASYVRLLHLEPRQLAKSLSLLAGTLARYPEEEMSVLCYSLNLTPLMHGSFSVSLCIFFKYSIELTAVS